MVITADTTNYYDRIAHPADSVTKQHFGMQLEYLLVPFTTIYSINMFLEISYGVSERFHTRSQEITFQGDVQDNEAISPIWLK